MSAAERSATEVPEVEESGVYLSAPSVGHHIEQIEMLASECEHELLAYARRVRGLLSELGVDDDENRQVFADQTAEINEAFFAVAERIGDMRSHAIKVRSGK